MTWNTLFSSYFRQVQLTVQSDNSDSVPAKRWREAGWMIWDTKGRLTNFGNDISRFTYNTIVNYTVVQLQQCTYIWEKYLYFCMHFVTAHISYDILKDIVWAEAWRRTANQETQVHSVKSVSSFCIDCIHLCTHTTLVPPWSHARVMSDSGDEKMGGRCG